MKYLEPFLAIKKKKKTTFSPHNDTFMMGKAQVCWINNWRPVPKEKSVVWFALEVVLSGTVKSWDRRTLPYSSLVSKASVKRKPKHSIPIVVAPSSSASFSFIWRLFCAMLGLLEVRALANKSVVPGLLAREPSVPLLKNTFLIGVLSWHGK